MIHDEPWAAGTPAWVDLQVPDRTVAHTFYSAVLGWEFLPDSGPETGYYAMAHRGGKLIAGVGQGDQPPVWTTYLATDDVDATVARAQGAGATIVVPPDSIGDSGRLAVIIDPLGATVGFWQSGQHTGASLVNEPGTQVWNELRSNDLAAAKAFYGHVFGYTFDDMSGDGFEYATIAIGDAPAVGGLGGKGTLGEGETARWDTYFATDDTDATVERAVAHGASVVAEPSDAPYGRMATLRGPSGELFTLMSTTVQATVFDADGGVG
ncbi:MAG: VOC family protein [Cellulomonadaceae bacterium]|nr:VOC family protein [Cellulomonadaceae bacterium]